MRLDFQKHDALVLLACDHRKGVWASECFVRNSKTVRNAGQISTTASAHTLQLVALVNALRSISFRQAIKLVDAAPRGTLKPRVLVTSLDPTFLDALQTMNNIRADSAPKKPLRAGQNFVTLLTQQLVRFILDIQPLHADDNSGLVLLNWARKGVIDPRVIVNTPAFLRPTAVSAMV
jgi:hypothetical protein